MFWPVMFEGVKQKELCVQKRELDDVAMLLQCKPVCSCKSTYILFQYFFVMYIYPVFAGYKNAVECLLQ